MVNIMNRLIIVIALFSLSCGGNMKIPGSLLEKIIEHNVEIYKSDHLKADIFEQKIYFSTKTRKYYYAELFTYNKDRGNSVFNVYIFDANKLQLLHSDGEVKLSGSRLIVGGEYALTIKEWSTMIPIKVNR